MNEPPPRLPIGTVPYTNAEPLVRPLRSNPAYGVDLTAAPPSSLAARLADGAIEAGLIPSVEILRRGLATIPGIAIASRGHAESVRLHLRRPIEQVRRVALDVHSRASNALAKVLLKRRWRLSPAYVDYDPRDVPPDRFENADAAVTIGDVSFRPSPLPFIDLGGAWAEETGLPFVFALWAHRPGHPQADRLAKVLTEAKVAGLESREVIAAEVAPRMGRSVAAALRYLTQSIHYDFGPEEEKGLDLFRTWLREDGLLDPP